MAKYTRSLLVVLSLLVSGLTVGSTAPTRAVDGGQIPVVVLPSDSSIASGDPDTVTVTLSGTTTANQTVQITSSDPNVVPVPSTVTVPSGYSSTSFQTQSPQVALRKSIGKSEVVTITATCNGSSASGQITVN